MLQEQVLLYIRENMMMIRMAAAGAGLFLLLVVWIQVTRTRREVHKICKKIRKYFDVILAEDTQAEESGNKEKTEAELPSVYQTTEELKLQEERKTAEDAKLLMDVISEVF